MSHSCFIRLSTDGHLGYFHTLAIVNNAAMNIGVLMFFWISVLGSFGYIPRSGITGSKGRSIFNFLRYLHTVFHSGCASLHSHQQCRRVPLSPHPHQQLLIYGWWPFMTGVRWSLIVVFICISLMISDIECLFIRLIGHLYVLFGEVSIQVPYPFFNWIVWFFDVEFCKFFYKVWILTLYQMYWQICSPVLWVIFIFCWWFPLLCKNFSSLI